MSASFLKIVFRLSNFGSVEAIDLTVRKLLIEDVRYGALIHTNFACGIVCCLCDRAKEMRLFPAVLYRAGGALFLAPRSCVSGFRLAMLMWPCRCCVVVSSLFGVLCVFLGRVLLVLAKAEICFACLCCPPAILDKCPLVGSG